MCHSDSYNLVITRYSLAATPANSSLQAPTIALHCNAGYLAAVLNTASHRSHCSANIRVCYTI